jgi:hypothetical protein
MLAGEIGLRRDERLELAEQVLLRDVESWKDLSDDEMCRILDSLQGFQYVSHQLASRVE